VCPNNVRPRIADLDALKLNKLQTRVLTPQSIEQAVRDGIRQAAERLLQRPHESDQLRAELNTLCPEITRSSMRSHWARRFSERNGIARATNNTSQGR